MARIDDLVAQVANQALRKKIQDALADMKRLQRFGLVFEEHTPETSTLFGLPVQRGAFVQRRDDPSTKTIYRVASVTAGGNATIEPQGGGDPEPVPVGDLLVVKQF